MTFGCVDDTARRLLHSRLNHFRLITVRLFTAVRIFSASKQIIMINNFFGGVGGLSRGWSCDPLELACLHSWYYNCQKEGVQQLFDINDSIGVRGFANADQFTKVYPNPVCLSVRPDIPYCLPLVSPRFFLVCTVSALS